MARKPKSYWEKRSTELMLSLEKGTENTIDDLIQVYNQATRNINKEINRIFKNYAKDTGLSQETLTSMLNKKETDAYYNNLLQVINNNIIDENIKKKLIAKYNAPAYAYRINRYQALQDFIDVELSKVADIEQTITKQRYINTIQEGYYHNIYDIQKGLGIGFNFSQLDMKTINLMLNEKWTNKGNYSTRIWNNKDKLSNYLKIQLTADTMSGKSIHTISKELEEHMHVGLYNATRLVRTEVNYFANESEMLSYEECGIEKYKFIATLDNVTCDHCAELDNKVFKVKNRKAGVNYPPLHPLDRCSTVAEFDDDVTEDLQRRARDENGKSILVPQDMNYNQWYAKYVEGSDYIVKTQGTYNGINEKKSIKQAIKTIPKNYRDLLKDITFDIISSGNSRVKGNTIYIIRGADKYEVIHEIGHIISDKLRLNNDSRFINIINNTLANFSEEDIIYDPNTFTKGIFRIESNKFITEYQGRMYSDEKFVLENKKINYKAFKDYFPEALRIYYQDNELLKRKNNELYNYVEDLLTW